ncbi:MAG: PilZ domain-containing protein [Candidatus Binatia bacterium]
MPMTDRREESILSSGQLLGVLRREVQVRLLNLSGSGCLMESERRVEPGTIGRLRIMLGGDEYADDVRIVRCQAIEGGSIYHVGVEFVWTAPPHPRSLRRALSRGGDELAARVSFVRPM